jgi:phage recombination protein Bet
MQTDTQIATRNEERSISFVPFGAADAIKLNVALVKKFIAVPTKQGKVCTDEQAMKFLMLCQAQRLNPWAGDAFLIGYDTSTGPSFSMVTAHQAFLKRAESSEDFQGMESGIIIRSKEDDKIEEIQGDFYVAETHEVLGGWAKVYHAKRKFPTYRRLRVERFNKGFGEWNKDAAGMICKCAEADALRSTFPTLCGGMVFEGDALKEVIDVTTQTSKTASDRTLKPATGATQHSQGATITTPKAASEVAGQQNASESNLAVFQVLSREINIANLDLFQFYRWLKKNEYVPELPQPITFEAIAKHLTPKIADGLVQLFSAIEADVRDLMEEAASGLTETSQPVAEEPANVVTMTAAELRAAEIPPETAKAPLDESPLGMLRTKTAEAGLTEAQVVQWARESKKIAAGVTTFEGIIETSPSVINYMVNTFAKIVQKINAK